MDKKGSIQVIMASLLLFLAGVAQAETFEVSSLEESWSVAGKIGGQYEIKPGFVSVRIEEGLIARLKYGKFPRRKIIGINVCLAKWTADGRGFEFAAKSEIKPIDQVIDIDETIQLEPCTIDIPTKGMTEADIRRTWLAFSIINRASAENEKAPTGYSYIHATTYLSSFESTGFPKPH